MANCDCVDTLCKGSWVLHLGQDAPLYDLCARKLLIRGWAGIYTDDGEGFRRDRKPPSEAVQEKGRSLARLQYSDF